MGDPKHDSRSRGDGGAQDEQQPEAPPSVGPAPKPPTAPDAPPAAPKGTGQGGQSGGGRSNTSTAAERAIEKARQTDAARKAEAARREAERKSTQLDPVQPTLDTAAPAQPAAAPTQAAPAPVAAPLAPQVTEGDADALPGSRGALGAALPVESPAPPAGQQSADLITSMRNPHLEPDEVVDTSTGTGEVTKVGAPAVEDFSTLSDEDLDRRIDALRSRPYQDTTEAEDREANLLGRERYARQSRKTRIDDQEMRDYTTMYPKEWIPRVLKRLDQMLAGDLDPANVRDVTQWALDDSTRSHPAHSLLRGFAEFLLPDGNMMKAHWLLVAAVSDTRGYAGGKELALPLAQEVYARLGDTETAVDFAANMDSLDIAGRAEQSTKEQDALRTDAKAMTDAEAAAGSTAALRVDDLAGATASDPGPAMTEAEVAALVEQDPGVVEPTEFNLDDYIRSQRTALDKESDAYLLERFGARGIGSMEREWQDAKDAEGDARLDGAISRLEEVNQRALKSQSYDDLLEYLDVREAETGEIDGWTARAREVLAQVTDTSTDLTELDTAALDAEIDSFYMLMLADQGNFFADKPTHKEPRKTQPLAEEEQVTPASPTRTQQRIADAIAAIRQTLSYGFFPLTGDGEKGHSEAVKTAIAETLAFFGYDPFIKKVGKDGKPLPNAKLERFLFIAFQLYRGMSIDRKGLLFKQKAEAVAIKDADFIAFLHEIRGNTLTHNNPFAYTNLQANFAGVLRYPTLMTPALAEFFAGHTQNSQLNTTPKELVQVNIKQWNEVILPRIATLAYFDQREVLLDIVDAVVQANPVLTTWGAEMRTAEERLLMSELLDAQLAVAALRNDKNKLAEAQRDRIEVIKRAILRRDAKLRRGGRDRRGGDGDLPAGFWADVYKSSSTFKQTLKNIAVIARIMGVIGRMQLAVTGVAEKARGTFDVWSVQWARRKAAKRRGLDVSVTQESLDLISEGEPVAGIAELLQILNTQGKDGIYDAASNGVSFGTGEAKAAAKQAVESASEGTRTLTRFRLFIENQSNKAMTLSTGDFVCTRAQARIFLKQLILEHAESRERGEVGLTTEQIQEALKTNVAQFLRDAMLTPQGGRALIFVSNASLAGANPLTDGLRQFVGIHPLLDVAIGFTCSWYMRFGINVALRFIPFSYTAMYLVKTKGIDAAARAAGKSEAAIYDSNETLLGGNGDFASGLHQNILLDLAHATSSFAAFMIIMSITMILGVRPPDKEEYDLAWYEWKIGGKAIKEMWFWNDLLGIAMPLAIGIHAGMQKNDTQLAWRIITNGAYEKLLENPWSNVAQAFDVINNFDESVRTAQARAMGEDIPDAEDVFWANIAAYVTRRGLATFEPAIVRDIWGEHGLGGGQQDLAHSRNMVHTGDEKNPTDPTTPADAIKRGLAQKSPGLAALMDLQAGIFGRANPDKGVTGYQRTDQPEVRNVDATNQHFVDRLSVYDENGKPKPVEQWTEKEKQERIDYVLKMLKTFQGQPAKLAACGVVIPYDARHLTDHYLKRQKERLRGLYEIRKTTGEWDYKTNGLGYPETEKRKIAAWDEMSAEQAKVQERIDMLWGDDIPYSAMRYRAWEGNWRMAYAWKEGTEKAGQPATRLEHDFNKDNIEMVMYRAGDHKTSFMPYAEVDDQGDPSFDAQTPVGWLSDQTDRPWTLNELKGERVARGMDEGKLITDLLTGGGHTAAANVRGPQRYRIDEFLTGSRGLLPYRPPAKELEKDDFPYKDWSKAEPQKAASSGGRAYWSGSGGGGGGGGFAPNIFSHPAYSLNTDKPASLYAKVPSYTRIDYLRPSFQTKGSREAYRREDF